VIRHICVGTLGLRGGWSQCLGKGWQFVFAWEEAGDIYYLGEETPGLRANRGYEDCFASPREEGCKLLIIEQCPGGARSFEQHLLDVPFANEASRFLCPVTSYGRTSKSTALYYKELRNFCRRSVSTFLVYIALSILDITLYKYKILIF